MFSWLYSWIVSWISKLSFLTASALWWLWLIPAIILLYFLKLKRQEVVFPSTLLWRRVVEDMRVNSPFQRLRNNLLLFLQILILLLIILALAQLVVKTTAVRGKNVVVLIDTSASMQALDPNGKSRLQLAKEKTLEMIDSMDNEDRMMVISFAHKAKIEQIFTSMDWKLQNAVENLQVTDTETNLEEALLIAHTVVQKFSSAEIQVITDGAIAELDKLLEKTAGQKDIPKFLIVGETKENVGIISFDVRPDPGKKTYQAFVLLKNFGDQTVEGLLQLSINGEPLIEDIRLIELSQREPDGVLFEGLLFEEGLLEAQFTLQKGKDHLAIDDRAWFVVPPLQKNRICLVTEENFFLEKVLTPHDRNLQVMTPQQYEQMNEQNFTSLFDMVVFDGYTPKKALPPGGYLFFNCVPPEQVVLQQGEIGKEGERLQIIDQKDIHPAMRFIDLRKISLAKALQLKWPEDAEPLLEAETQAIIGTVRRKSNYYIIVGFDIFQTDWPLRLSFPVFVANAIRWLQNIRNRQNITTGELIHYRVPDDGEIALTPPGQKQQPKRQVNKGEDMVFSGTERAGVYSIALAEEEISKVAANLFSEYESNIAPRQQIKIGNKNVASRAIQPADLPLWWYLVIVGFSILLIEWYVFHRRSLFAWLQK